MGGNIVMSQEDKKDSSQVNVVYIIKGDPIPLARPRIGSSRLWDSQKHLKLVVGLDLQKQHGTEPLYCGPLHLVVDYFMRMPDGQRKKWELFRSRPHVYKPDLSNLVKFTEDVCSAILFKDDCLIAKITAKKYYDDNPRTEFRILEMR